MKPRQKSHQKVKKEATQEFFNKKRTGSTGPNKTKESFTFNKAPINKQDAKKEIIEQRDKPVKRSAFTAKLYADDDEVENMKILQGDQFESDEETRKPRARDRKANEKLTKEGFAQPSKSVSTSKIGKLVSDQIINHFRLSEKGVSLFLPSLRSTKANTPF